MLAGLAAEAEGGFEAGHELRRRLCPVPRRACLADLLGLVGETDDTARGPVGVGADVDDRVRVALAERLAERGVEQAVDEVVLGDRDIA
ncbi:hypothetical protein [Streptomyces sp. TLI_105]|uniref:hypothetical protein n=1 Tax=Streptomyces sp. TLI_105 TaxID=1881019 RepID=UPI000B86ADF9|nr:hypothetical protein [Streptomyces sp. TLI_105]